MAHADGDCLAALDLFCSFLGEPSRAIWPWRWGRSAGVYIGCGIAPRIVAQIERSSFRSRFEAKGRFGDYLAEVPALVIDVQVSPALVGASRALDMEDGPAHSPRLATRPRCVLPD